MDPRQGKDRPKLEARHSPGNRSPSSILSELYENLKQEGTTFLVAGAVALLAAGAWYAVSRTLDGWVRGLAIGGVVAIAVYLLLRPEDVRRLFSRRAARYGSNALLLSVAVIGIVVLANVLANRHYARFDVTAGNLHTLSPQSIQILDQILEAPDQQIEIIGVYPGGQGQEDFERWLDEYRAYADRAGRSDGGGRPDRISYRTLDPIRQPGEADRLGWDAYGSGLIVSVGGRSQQVHTPDEQDITSALLKVSRDTVPVVYFLSGHGEPSPTGSEEDDYGQIGALLADNNYEVRTLNLAVTGTVPSDAALLVLAGPETPLLPDERASLRTYLQSGGKALIMLDPGVESGINDVLAPWEVRVEDMVVVDLQRGLSGDVVTPVIDRYAFSQITKDLPMVALPLACPIVGPVEGDTVEGYQALAQTSVQSWADSDVPDADGSPAGDLAYDESTDLRGPLTLLATVEVGETRIVLVGDSDLATNAVLQQIPNGQYLLLNAVNWLAEEEELIAIGPKANVPRTIQMSTIQEGTVCFGSLILIPGAVLVAGLAVWLRRR
jgi:ABC-type uncharacterized transport system involved in gliding motility auxiliary subunit